MNKNLLRKNYTSLFVSEKNIIRGKLAFKTKETGWLDSDQPVIILISSQSDIHAGIDGDLKMNAFISTIRRHVKGKITILLADTAHLSTIYLKHPGRPEQAFHSCLESARVLSKRYQSYFEGCNVAYWHSYINGDKNFTAELNRVGELYRADAIFRSLMAEDVEATYTLKRQQEFPDKNLYIDKTIEDLQVQCASESLLARKGYRHQFYTGKSYASTQYFRNNHMSLQLSWIDVYLSIEKKTVIPHP